MNYQQTIEYLFHKLPMFSRIGAAAFKKDLSNTITLCNKLDNPQNKFKSIHIAGTNGKGSVSHMVAAVLQTAGYKVGLYTSPHLKDFRERIKINGALCNKDYVIDFVEKINPLIDEIEPSFFEITVAMAFEYFAIQKVDIAVVEVGLGGRLDSTNIINPELCVITNIGWDHMNMLGDSLEKIAFEKAGIIKQNIPVIIGEVIRETQSVFEEIAHQKHASLIYAEHKRYVTDWKYEHHQLQITVTDVLSDERTLYKLDLTGIYQIKNLVTFLEAVHQLKLQGWKIDDVIISDALSKVKKITGLHGRWEVVHQHPTIVLDVGHNEDGIKQIAEQLELIDYPKLHIVIGFVKDKDIREILLLLPKKAKYYFTKAQIPRALHETELAEIAAGIGLQGNFYSEVNVALNEAKQNASKNDLILVCGSVFLVGEVD